MGYHQKMTSLKELKRMAYFFRMPNAIENREGKLVSVLLSLTIPLTFLSIFSPRNMEHTTEELIEDSNEQQNRPVFQPSVDCRKRTLVPSLPTCAESLTVLYTMVEHGRPSD